MFDKVVEFSLHHRLAIFVATLVVIVWGILSFQNLTIEAFPDSTDTQVNVISIYPGQPSEEMERQVSIPIERVVNGIPGLTRVRSINLFGLSFVTLTFRDEIDVLFARSQTLERLRLAELPPTVQPQLGSLSTPIGEIYRYVLVSDNQDALEQRTTQDWVVRPRMLRVDGVADVVSYGGLVREIQIHPDPVALASKSLTVRDIGNALRASSLNASGGIVERGSEQLVIRSEGLFASIDDIKRVVVAARGGTPTFLSDVASVQDGWLPRQGIVGRGRDPEVVEGIVLMRRGCNPSQVLEQLRARVKELNDFVLPKGYKIVPFYDRTELVSSTLKTVGRNLLEGAVLVVGVLFVFLLDLRAALVVAAVIPLSLLCAFIYLYQRGMAANLISLGAVDFGIIVDGGVVIIESIARRMSDCGERELDTLDLANEIRIAVKQVARPTVFSLLMIIAAYLPIFLLQRVEGRIFAPMAHTVVAALLGSLAFSITLVPVLALFAYRKPRAHQESAVLRAASAAYLPVLRGALRRPILVGILAIGSLLLAARILVTRGSEFLPELNEGGVYLTMTLPANASLNEGRRLAPVVVSLLEGLPEVESTMSQLGRPEDGTDPKLSNNLEIFIKLKPAEQWPSSTPNLEALFMKLQRRVADIPGVEANFSQPIRDNVNDSISGQPGQVAVKVYGNDLDELQKAAEAAKKTLSTVRGVADLSIVKAGVVPQIQVKPKREQLGRFGMMMEDVQGFISMALGGSVVGDLWERDRSFNVVLRLPEDSRDTLEKISSLRVPSPMGALVPVTSVADIGVAYGRAAINRENGQRYVGVRMNVRGRDMGTFVDEARAAVQRDVRLSPGMSIEWGGEFESKERAMHRLRVVVPMAIILTLALLFQAFRSISLATLVLLNVPFALVGGAVGLWAFGMPFSIAAAVGFIALAGQASLNGVLVLSAIEELRKAGVPIDDAIVQGARDRLRPVLMTAALAALGLVPAAFSRAMGAETQRPIAVVIVGGTVSAAVLTLVVLPVMYRGAIRVLQRVSKSSALGEELSD